MRRGIRQGCPLSGQLYSLAIEPLLNLLRTRVKGVRVPGADKAITVSAYADDVTVLIQDQEDVQALEADDVTVLIQDQEDVQALEADDVTVLIQDQGDVQALEADDVTVLIQDQGVVQALEADDVSVLIQDQGMCRLWRDVCTPLNGLLRPKWNWGITEALLGGLWRGRTLPTLPGNVHWGRQGMKILGVHLGADEYLLKNWEGIEGKVSAKLEQWKWIVPWLSHRGRAL